MKFLKQIGSDTLITVKVKTRQSLNMIRLENDELFIYVKDPPIKNKANRTIVKLMRKRFKNDVNLEYGQNRTTKVLRICNMSPSQLLELLR